MENEERDQALKNIRQYAKNMKIKHLGAKEIEHVVEIQNATKRRQKEKDPLVTAFLAKHAERKVAKEAGNVTNSSALLANLLELSVITVDKVSPPIYSMIPIKRFKSSWGHEVRSMTALADRKGVI